jgi:hypothetical protein
MTNKKFVLGVAGLAALLTVAEYVRKPLEFTDTLVGYSVNKTDANYALKFNSNCVESTSLNDSTGEKVRTGNVYLVEGYQNFWGKHAKTVERILDN